MNEIKKDKIRSLLWKLIHDFRVEKDDDEKLVEAITKDIINLYKS